MQIRQWKQWEESVSKDRFDAQEFTHVQDHDFIKNRFRGVGKSLGLQSFCKQFYGSVTKADYATLRLGFIMNHCRGNPKFDFHKYMMRVFEADCKKVVGIRLVSYDLHCFTNPKLRPLIGSSNYYLFHDL